jgi:hypothetical protein
MSKEKVEPLTLLQKLLDIQQRLRVPKEEKNEYAGFSYKSAVHIIEKVKSLLKEHKLVLTIEYEPVLVGDWHYIKATVSLACIESKESKLCVAYAREAKEKTKSDCGQLTGGASSYALKYALSCLFCLDDSKDDPDSQKHEPAKQQIKKSDFEIKNAELLKEIRGFVLQMNDQHQAQSVKEVQQAIKSENQIQLKELLKIYKG